MKRAHRELSMDKLIHRAIFENNQITLFLCFNFISKTCLLYTSDAADE